MHTHRWLIVVAAAALAGAGCYKTPQPNCTFTCGEGGACPSDYACGTDNICHLMQSGSLAPCAQSFADASFDGPEGDAPVADAPVFDAPETDARPVDAHDDAAPADASPIDSRPVDAMPPDASPPDASPPDAMVDANTCPSLAIMDDGTQGAGGQDLVISLVQPTNSGKVELYNTTGADIDLSTRTFFLVSPTTSVSLATSGVTVKSHGYATVPWTFGDQSGGGEVVLYHDSTEGPSDMDAFLCWDTDGNANSAKADAMTANKWSGNCAAALTGTAIERKNDVAGTQGSDFDSTSTRAPRNCP